MGEVAGPFKPSELKTLAESGKLPRDSFVRKGSDGKWISAERVTGLQFKSEPTPPPISTTPAPKKRNWVFTILTIAGGLILFLGLASVLDTYRAYSARDVSNAEFSTNDLDETVRWGVRCSQELNELPYVSNDLIHRDNVAAAKQRALVLAKKAVGKTFNWKMDCSVSEDYLLLLPDTIDYRNPSDSKMVITDARYLTDKNRSPVPTSWYMSLDIPEELSVDEAKKYTGDAIVSGRVAKVEIERFDRDLSEYEKVSDDEVWYLTFLYLTDIVVKPE